MKRGLFSPARIRLALAGRSGRDVPGKMRVPWPGSMWSTASAQAASRSYVCKDLVDVILLGSHRVSGLCIGCRRT